MSEIRSESGYAPVNGARLYYEVAGEGTPFVMIHAGVADHRQWNNEFAFFANRFRVVRYDLRSFGQSEPVDGEYRHLDDLVGLLDYLDVDRPAVMMGCSMGGGLAMEFTLAHPERVAALIMVDSAPNGLDLEVPEPELFQDAEQAYLAGDWDRLAELEVQIWYVGFGRTREQVEPAMLELGYAMNRLALAHHARGLGQRLPDATVPAAERLGEIQIPVLVMVGEHDIAYMHAAVDYVAAHLTAVRTALIKDAGHLANMDHPEEFQCIVGEFLKDVGLVRQP